MSLTNEMESLEIAESEALDSWEDELASTPEDEVSESILLCVCVCFTSFVRFD